MPALARRSMFGVLLIGLPKQLGSAKPISSIKITTIFGFSSLAGQVHAGMQSSKNVVATKPIDLVIPHNIQFALNFNVGPTGRRNCEYSSDKSEKAGMASRWLTSSRTMTLRIIFTDGVTRGERPS